MKNSQPIDLYFYNLVSTARRAMYGVNMILRDKTMDMIYIPNDNKQNNGICRLILIEEYA